MQSTEIREASTAFHHVANRYIYHSNRLAGDFIALNSTYVCMLIKGLAVNQGLIVNTLEPALFENHCSLISIGLHCRYCRIDPCSSDRPQSSDLISLFLVLFVHVSFSSSSSLLRAANSQYGLCPNCIRHAVIHPWTTKLCTVRQLTVNFFFLLPNIGYLMLMLF